MDALSQAVLNVVCTNILFRSIQDHTTHFIFYDNKACDELINFTCICSPLHSIFRDFSPIICLLCNFDIL